MWGSIEKVRNISGITKEQINDIVIYDILEQTDRKVRDKVYTFRRLTMHADKIGTNKIRFDVNKIGDGNMDTSIDDTDIFIYRMNEGVYELFPIEKLDILSNEITFQTDIGENYEMIAEYFEDNFHFSIDTLSDASSLFAAAMCMRSLPLVEEDNNAKEYERRAKEIITRSSASFI